MEVPPMEIPSKFGQLGNEASAWMPITKRFASM
jgi:hypothetical protein